ncbi:D-mannonate oxidoreductase [Vibrio nigripulchritudo ATCC 27043]|uniref:mannitol dehydrogenase family protein n=1 Tax=Vibrio nigripulchritudo TaxID=28173 RepID=UPI00021C1BFB|nr:fructuronate reductase [Vibrio nigripulchritudo]EGU57634.1 D-mannonate oxidoreductase [Vibrio nigripulchritudo ATCC 27043]
MKTISNSTLKEHVQVPDYDRSALQSRIVHIGFGAFHRAHQALYTDEMLSKSGSDWGICAVKLFSGAEFTQALREQDHLFTVQEKGAQTTEVKVIKSVTESLHPKLDGIQAVIDKMCESQVAIVSLTITEKGYCVDPATGTLDRNNPAVLEDLTSPSTPKSAIGYIVQALSIRREKGLGSFTVLSCDNMQENGRVAKAAVLEFARLLDPELSNWIRENVSFPCTMVDRIVPAATEDTLAEITEQLGCNDPCAIACEPFRQWVIEDDFVAGRPDWDLAGAEFVEDVLPYEEMKLRMLNGSHSFLAYLGYLSGYKYISDAIADSNFRQVVLDLMMLAQSPSLNMPEGTDIEGYANRLIERFSNPNLKHQTWQIAMDGSQKIPQRWGGSLQFHLNQGSEFSWLATAIAGWMRYVSGVDEQGRLIDVKDPMADTLRQICDHHGLNPSVVPALLDIDTIFSPDIGKNPKLIDAVSSAYQSLLDNGARMTVQALVR